MSLENDKEKIDYIFRQMSVGSYPNIYFIGRCASRLTFVSQQYRALNLIWALEKSGSLKKGTEVVIVGAGLAGLTAAYASHHLGASVTLIESKTEALHIQRGCEQRFIHPYILDWPEPDSEEKSFTDFPCLNWGAGMASQVCKTVFEQWLSVEGVIKPKYGFEVREIKRLGESDTPLIVAEGKEENLRKQCDILILAVGFGLERSIPSVPFLSYWENDNFSRPVITGKVPRSYFVTGCGDGGLIDAIRLQVKYFNHAYFIYDLQGTGGLDEIKNKLSNIDAEILERLDSEETKEKIDAETKLIDREQDPFIKKYFKGQESSKTFARDCIASRLLEAAYNEIEIPSELVKKLQLRQDTIVYLNSPYPSPFTLNSSVLNRFVVFLLSKYGHMRYRQGWVEVSKANMNQPFNVVVRSYSYPIETIEVDEVVSRHGPNHTIDKLFPRSIAEACRQPIRTLEDFSRTKLYDDQFLDLETLREEKQKVKLEYAVSRLPEAMGSFEKGSEYNRYGVKINNGNIVYYIETQKELNVSQRKKKFYEFKFEFEWEEPERQALAPINSSMNVLRYGAGINLIDKAFDTTQEKTIDLGLASVCCFVKSLDTGKPGLLTAANSITNPQGLQIGDSLSLADLSVQQSKDSVATITYLKLAIPSSFQANLVTDTIRFNWYDALIAELHPHIEYSSKYLANDSLLKIDKLFNNSDSDLNILRGKEVFKVGAATGVTRGVIEEVSVSAKFYKWGEQFWYERLIKIVGVNDQPFAKFGDEGSGVIDNDGQLIGMLIDSVDKNSYACFVCSILKHSGFEPAF